MNLAVSAIRAELNAPPAIARILWVLYEENRDLWRDEIADLTGLKQSCIKVYLCNLRASFYGHWLVVSQPGCVGLTRQGRDGVKAILKRMLQEAKMVFARQPKFSDLTQQDRDDLWNRLAWRYSPARADMIMAGKDEATRVDRGKWRLLGALTTPKN